MTDTSLAADNNWLPWANDQFATLLARYNESAERPLGAADVPAAAVAHARAFAALLGNVLPRPADIYLNPGLEVVLDWRGPSGGHVSLEFDRDNIGITVEQRPEPTLIGYLDLEVLTPGERVPLCDVVRVLGADYAA